MGDSRWPPGGLHDALRHAGSLQDVLVSKNVCLCVSQDGFGGFGGILRVLASISPNAHV